MGDLQVFTHDPIRAVKKFVGLLVQKVVTFASNLRMRLAQCAKQPVPARGILFRLAEATLKLLQIGQSDPERPWPPLRKG
jgi:hypothetical protein